MKTHIKCSIIIFLIFLCGCSAQEILDQAPTRMARKTETTTSSINTQTLPIPTNTVLKFTASHQSTTTPTSQNTTVTVEPTIPTLSGNKEEQEMLCSTVSEAGSRELCLMLDEVDLEQFPCWWGICPAETKWDEVEGKLGRLEEFFELPDDFESINSFHIFFMGHTLADFLGEEYGLDYLSMSNKNNTVKSISVDGPKFSEKFSLESIFEILGRPDQIFVYPSQDVMGTTPPVTLFLVWKEIGVRTIYHFPAEATNEAISFCADGSLTMINLWAPGDHEIESWMDEQHSYHLPIAELEEYSVENFYTEVIEKGFFDCIQIQNEVWMP